MVRYGCYPVTGGILVIGYTDTAVVSLKLAADPPCPSDPSPVSELAARQIMEFFSGTWQTFDFPMEPGGTAFQLKVWQALLQIPYGETRTYARIAAAIGNPAAARAVGQAVNKNPIWIAIPCHRVIGNSGSLTGYAGGLELKKTLLELEARNS